MELPDPIFEIAAAFLFGIILIALAWNILRNHRELMDRCIYVLYGRMVLDYLEVQGTLWDNSQRGYSVRKRANPRTVSEIAAATGMAEWRVRCCLRQLAHRRLVEEGCSDQWRLIPYE
jgi:hypothetical protein